MRKVSLLAWVAVALGVGVGIASASAPDGGGAREPGARTVAYYVEKDATDAEVHIAEAPGHTNLLKVHLPDASGQQGYLGTATFTLVNFGSVDAQVNCDVGNRMGHELFVPVNQLSDPSLGGLWTQNIVTVTLTGMVRGGGTLALGCHVVDWVGAGHGTPAPQIGFRRGSLEVLYLPRLNDLTPSLR